MIVRPEFDELLSLMRGLFANGIEFIGNFVGSRLLGGSSFFLGGQTN